MTPDALIDEFHRIGLELAKQADTLTADQLQRWADLIDEFDHDAKNEQDDRTSGLK